MGNFKYVNWFGEKLLIKEIAERYDLHKATISTYFRMEEDKKNPCEGVLKRIKLAKSDRVIQQRSNTIKDDFGDMGPRKNIESIPRPTDYEKKLWGY